MHDDEPKPSIPSNMKVMAKYIEQIKEASAAEAITMINEKVVKKLVKGSEGIVTGYFSLKSPNVSQVPKKLIDAATFSKTLALDMSALEKIVVSKEMFEKGDTLHTNAELEDFIDFLKGFLPYGIEVDVAHSIADLKTIIAFSMWQHHIVEIFDSNTKHSKLAIKAVFEKVVAEFEKLQTDAMFLGKEKANEGDEMALKLNAFNGLATLKKIGVNQMLFDWFNTVGNVSYEGGAFVLKAGEFTAKVPMTLAHVQSANLGTLPTHVKKEYQASFGSALKSLYTNHLVKNTKDYGLSLTSAAPSSNLPKLDVSNLQNLIDKAEAEIKEEIYGLPAIKAKEHLIGGGGGSGGSLAAGASEDHGFGGGGQGGGSGVAGAIVKPNPFKSLKDAGYAQPVIAYQQPATITVVSSAKWPCFDLSELASASLIALRDADRLYQPVKGSTPGKRYYCVALNNEFRVGVAYNGNELSIRVESPEWQDNYAALASVFSGVSSQKSYTSMHIEVANDTMAAKVIGAILSGLGIAWDTPLPNLKVIKGLS